MSKPWIRPFFRFLNRFFMVPMFRLGLGAFIGNPFSGYIMILRTIGWKSGRVRHTPLNYAILDGCVYCTAGWGSIAHWYRNLQARPCVDVLLPGRTLSGVAEPVNEPGERLRAVRQVMKNGGFAGFLMGFNPWTAPDSLVEQGMAGLPVLRIRPTGVRSGAPDPGGWLWLLTLIVTVALVAIVVG